VAAQVTETPGILVVDDQPATLTALEELLAPLGHNVTTARSGEEALRRLLDEDFGVIVMDVRMPGMDGFETVELIRQRRRHEHTAIMFLTAADADAEQIRRGYSAGAVDYIVKPVDPDVLRSKVAMLLALVQKNAELRESERRFRAAFESAPIGMGLSSVDGRWIEVNNALCDMLGLPRADLMERPPAELAHPEDRGRLQSAVERVMRERRGFHQAELRFIRSDGEVGYALVSLSLSLDTQERPLHLIWQMLDMTDRRRAAMETAARVRAETLAGTLSKLQQVTAAALEQQRLRGTLEALVEGISEAFGADLARILLRDPDDESRLRVGAASGFRGLAPDDAVPLTGVLDQVLSAPRTITLADLSVETELDPSLAAGRPRALMATPLFVSGEVAGVLEVGLCSSRRWDADEESLLGLMADRAGFAIANAQAYERELGTVEMFQHSLLLKPEDLPQPDGLRIWAKYESGGAVGGDWYDALELGGGRIAVALGDVVGHGLGAAALMAQLRHATRAYALEGHSPAGVLDRLDGLVRSLDGGQMATLLYLVVEPDRASVRLASAGHVPPLVIGPDGQPEYLDSSRDPPLGVFESASHSETELELVPGSTLVLYTDGLVEQRGVSIDAGLDALRAAARDPGEDPEALCERLVKRMLDVHDSQDDIAVLVLRALPVPAGPLRLELPADPDRLSSMRHQLMRWLRARGLEDGDVDAIQIACHEACSNAVEHGCGFGPGTVTVEAALDNGRSEIEVRDSGHWVERPDGPLPFRGHGLPLMEALMDSVEVVRGDEGTSVRLARQVPWQASEECSSTQSNGSATRASASPSEERSST
jgi:PAS domain S-box-containing protein